MYKLIVKLSNHLSPLEPAIISNGLIEKEIDVEDINDIQDVLDKVEKLVEAINDRDRGAVSVEVSNELHGVILCGTIKDGSFNGVSCS